ncbi:MAG: tetratricopeptide repeat protein [Magnetococcales bacterium]|nr:tetratricopeptide repeat protein [Magnetococcales bacterium]
MATSLNNLAGLYYAQSQYAQAEPLFKCSLVIWEKALGSVHPQNLILKPVKENDGAR